MLLYTSNPSSSTRKTIKSMPVTEASWMSWKATIWDFKGIINTAFVFPSCMFSIGSRGGKKCFISIHPRHIFAQQAFLSTEVRAEDECMHCLPSTSPEKHWFLFSFHSCWHLFVFLWDGNRICDLFSQPWHLFASSMTFRIHQKPRIPYVRLAEQKTQRDARLQMEVFLSCSSRTHIFSWSAWNENVPIWMHFEHVQYHFHSFSIEPTDPEAKNALKTFHKLFLIYRIPSPTIKNYSTFFLQTISQFFPLRISLNNMFSSHSTPRISHKHT